MKNLRKRVLILVGFGAIGSVLLGWARWRPAERFDGRPLEANEVRVVTWNVGYFAPVSDKNMHDVDLGDVTHLLQTTGANVVVLQELRTLRQAEVIANGLGTDWTAAAVKTGHGEQVLAVLSSMPVVEQHVVESGGRLSVGLSLTTPTGSRLFVLGVHAPHPARGARDNIESIEGALAFAQQQVEPVRIVTGDMNCNFDSDSRDRLYREILTNWGDGTVEIGETYYAHTRIDHMFHQPQALPVSAIGSGLIDFRMRLAAVPGFRDHRPIVVTYVVE